MSIEVTWERGPGGLPQMHWSFESEAQDAFSRYGLIHELSAGEQVFERGRGSDALFIVFEGEVAILKDAREVARVGKNQSFGEMGLLLDRPRAATAMTVADSRLLELTKDDLDRIQESEPVWAAKLYRVLAICLAEYLSAATSQG